MNNNDWRLANQINYLHKKHLQRIRFKHFKPGWDHEHCEFCSARIDADDNEAYTTEDKYYWICEECFNDFKDMFEWTVSSNEM